MMIEILQIMGKFAIYFGAMLILIEIFNHVERKEKDD